MFAGILRDERRDSNRIIPSLQIPQRKAHRYALCITRPQPPWEKTQRKLRHNRLLPALRDGGNRSPERQNNESLDSQVQPMPAGKGRFNARQVEKKGEPEMTPTCARCENETEGLKECPCGCGGMVCLSCYVLLETSGVSE